MLERFNAPKVGLFRMVADFIPIYSIDPQQHVTQQQQYIPYPQPAMEQTLPNWNLAPPQLAYGPGHPPSGQVRPETELRISKTMKSCILQYFSHSKHYSHFKSLNTVKKQKVKSLMLHSHLIKYVYLVTEFVAHSSFCIFSCLLSLTFARYVFHTPIMIDMSKSANRRQKFLTMVEY